jgi:hypothetical protein
MAQLVVSGAMVKCMFAAGPPVPLSVVPGAVTAGAPTATVMDFNPMVNIPVMGSCTSPSNPATKNPSGQAPCTPAIVAPWTPGSPSVMIGGQPALTDDSACSCTLGAPMCITITTAGQLAAGVSG